MNGVHAQSSSNVAPAWPDRPVTVVVGFPPGGSADFAARTLANHMQATLGQPFVVQNRGGANGALAAAQVKRAAPDGYTLFVSSIGTFVTVPHLMKAPGYDPTKDFDYISVPFEVPNVLVTGPAQPTRSVAEVVALLKKSPRQISFASSGNGASDHLGAELFWRQTGVEGLHVPYKGFGPALSDVLGGQVDFLLSSVNVLLPHIASGKLHALAVTDNVRSPVLPNVPTFAEAGIPGMEISAWQGLVAPAGLSPAVKKKISDAAIAAMRDPATVERLTKLGLKIVANTPEEFTAFQQREYVRWRTLIKERKITAD
ncbi:MAG: tripartite tricarboxylate transporter substrate binding protein [Polaromonas sp.]|nr:tripartite tricarboxylate transporter substrate binding protein [Polaromonas sp.]